MNSDLFSQTRLAILGPGLLGGSIALAARALDFSSVSLWARREAAVLEARSRAVAERISTDLSAIVHDADLVILCVPIGAMPALARELAPVLSSHAIVTDVGSVKAAVVAELGPIFSGRGRFVGSHPMAGSEQTGLAFARADLFAGAACVLTPDAETDRDALQFTEAFWKHLGARLFTMSPAEHDEAVAWISHFPHLLAATLVDLVAEKAPQSFSVSGPGFRDSTRVASGPPEMWAEILHENRAAVKKSADAMIEKLREIVTLLERDASMMELLNQAKTQRDRLRLPQ